MAFTRLQITTGALGVLLGVVLATAVSTPSAAGPAISCITGRSNVEATQKSQQGNHQGIRADTWFGNGDNTQCDHVVALFAINSNGYVEWGWTLGWLPGTDVGGSCGSTSQYYNSPRSFVAWKPINGSDRCRVEFGNTGGQFFDIHIKDENQNTLWGYYKSGTLINTVDVNFDRGIVATNGERHSSGDSAFANFKNLKFQVSGSTTFSNFSDLRKFADSDPQPGWSGNYNCIKISNTQTKVETATTSCPNN